MPIRAVRCTSSHALWEAFAESFLADNAGARGPGGFTSFAWLTHRIQRDALYRAAAARGVRAWLGPPVAFFSDLPRLFDIRQRPVGLLRRQHVIDNLAALHAGESARRAAFDRRGVGRAHDHLIGELLAEAVNPDDLERALGGLDGDAFSQRRNGTCVAVYRAYLEWLAAEARYDPRSIHALVAERIAAGGLTAALGGCRRLHIYGLTALRTRRRLLAALRAQTAVEVTVYVPAGDDAAEWTGAVDTVADLPAPASAAITIQPAPDERRELDWVTLGVKKLILNDRVPADRIAVVARSGREDNRAAHEALSHAGIPATARLRAGLDEVPALKAILSLFRGAAHDWPYRQLRQVLASPYFDLATDLRRLDTLATERRIVGLPAWGEALGTEGEAAHRLRSFAERAASLSAARPAREWIGITRELLDPGWFDFRTRVCRVDGAGDSRLDVVRIDQQAIVALDDLLAEWEEAEPDGPPVDPRDWHARLRRFLAGNEIAVSTPLRTGVQILEAHEAALFPFAHTFVIHANDGEFPRRPGSGWLFTDAELRQLHEAGLPVADREEALRRERVLWHAVTAGPRVSVTYRTADPNGVPLLPSLLVPPHDESSEIPRTKFVWEEAVTPAYADRLAASTLSGARRTGTPVSVPRVARIRQAIVNAVAERHRREQGESPWNGLVRDPAVLERLGARFGPDYHWSASSLEKYAQSPFVFLVEKVLELEEEDEAEEETSPLAFGSVAHALLEGFYRECKDSLPAEFDATARALYERVADAVFAEREAGPDWLGVPLLWAVTRRDIRRRVAAFLDWELQRLDDHRPHLLEHSFGFERDLDIAGTNVRGEHVRLRLVGRIDRVDRDGSGALHVVDYKSGVTPTPKEYGDGAALQGPLYLAAVQRTLAAEVATAVYLSIKSPKRAAKVMWGDTPCERALSLAFSIPARVCAGRFEPAAAASCGWKRYWPGADVCRVTEARDGEGSRFDE